MLLPAAALHGSRAIRDRQPKAYIPGVTLGSAARAFVNSPAYLARGIIRFYRYTLSSLVGRTCRHLPTCSEYADAAIARHGLWCGGWMAVARFWRCRPFGSHGFDPVPATLPDGAGWFTPWRYGSWAAGERPIPAERAEAEMPKSKARVEPRP